MCITSDIIGTHTSLTRTKIVGNSNHIEIREHFLETRMHKRQKRILHSDGGKLKLSQHSLPRFLERRISKARSSSRITMITQSSCIACAIYREQRGKADDGSEYIERHLIDTRMHYTRSDSDTMGNNVKRVIVHWECS
jgi:hypothetical protein